ncbi:MAG: hypothetical protein CMJ18_05490 [Phycisphaeraceae bacterium]|nr:hypothetical protein [Phycisphaeraceae bacterium]
MSRTIPLRQAATLLCVTLAGSAFADVTTIDFTEPGSGFLDPDFFADRGITFPPGGFVGFVQSDDVLVAANLSDTESAITGTFSPAAASLSVEVALSFQSVVDFTLSAFDADAGLVAATTFTLNQIVDDPGYAGFGHHAIDLGVLPRPARSFRLDALRIRPESANASFGMSSLVFDRVPEPATLAMLLPGLGSRQVTRRRR